jgi:hypothetical protein
MRISGERISLQERAVIDVMKEKKYFLQERAPIDRRSEDKASNRSQD